MRVDQYGFDEDEPRGPGARLYADAILRQASAEELADAAGEAFAVCARKAEYHRAEKALAHENLSGSSRLFGFDDERRREASWGIGYHHGRAEAWNASAIWWHAVAEAHRGRRADT